MKPEKESHIKKIFILEEEFLCFWRRQRERDLVFAEIKIFFNWFENFLTRPLTLVATVDVVVGLRAQSSVKMLCTEKKKKSRNANNPQAERAVVQLQNNARRNCFH